MGRVVFVLSLIIILTDCSGYEMCMLENNNRRGTVFLSEFSIRDNNYNPFLARNFFDRMRFELFRNGFEVRKSFKECVSQTAGEGEVAGAVKRDFLITGVISVKETGILNDVSKNTYVSFLIFDKSCRKIGEAVYSVGKGFDEQSVQKECAEKFVSTLIEKTESSK